MKSTVININSCLTYRALRYLPEPTRGLQAKNRSTVIFQKYQHEIYVKFASRQILNLSTNHMTPPLEEFTSTHNKKKTKTKN